MDLAAISGGREAAATVEHGEALVALVEAAIGRDAAALPAARKAVQDAVGPEGLVDACAVIGNFERMTRIADATGIPLDGPVAMLSDDFRAELGIDGFGSAGNTRPLTTLQRLLAPILRRSTRPLFRLLGRFGSMAAPPPRES